MSALLNRWLQLPRHIRDRLQRGPGPYLRISAGESAVLSEPDPSGACIPLDPFQLIRTSGLFIDGMMISMTRDGETLYEVELYPLPVYERLPIIQITGSDLHHTILTGICDFWDRVCRDLTDLNRPLCPHCGSEVGAMDLDVCPFCFGDLESLRAITLRDLLNGVSLPPPSPDSIPPEERADRFYRLLLRAVLERPDEIARLISDRS